ncbi:MAG: hypothetical protein H0T79_21830 [Deltaproteobacteria bacterium]|nr:hypothetical protein [Deltaproteobacteria bacterium]
MLKHVSTLLLLGTAACSQVLGFDEAKHRDAGVPLDAPDAGIVVDARVDAPVDAGLDGAISASGSFGDVSATSGLSFVGGFQNQVACDATGTLCASGGLSP